LPVRCFRKTAACTKDGEGPFPSTIAIEPGIAVLRRGMAGNESILSTPEQKCIGWPE